MMRVEPMKKIILVGLFAVCASTPALAIGRYNALSYTCAGAQDLIAHERAVIFRYPADRTKNMTLYDRYVLDTRSCDFGYYAYQSYMPTKDNGSCPVYTCRPATDFGGHDKIIP
ncbi:hypothetical protein [Neorhizobium sp. P12A]|uniref:hypothetical protein n=1 Tax=Neorhizobium sp. P12A TaxID=2268027 RepID=UPI001FF0711E|nr:hypothetical protein [Neorhizobium sp. P12A]